MCDSYVFLPTIVIQFVIHIIYYILIRPSYTTEYDDNKTYDLSLSLSLFLAAGALEDLAFERREVHQRSHEADAELSLLRRKAHEKDQACTAHDVGVPRSVG